MIVKGNLSAFYDNDFAKYLDDLNKSIDDNLAIYKTQEEKKYELLAEGQNCLFLG